VGRVEIVDAKKQSDSARELFSDNRYLPFAICAREENAGFSAARAHDHPPLGPSIVRLRRDVLDKIKLQDVDEKVDRYVVIADDERDEMKMRH
jgi:hypothetical protein